MIVTCLRPGAGGVVPYTGGEVGLVSMAHSGRPCCLVSECAGGPDEMTAWV